MAANSPVDVATINTNDIKIYNLPPKYCSVSKLTECFLNKKISGISEIMVDQNTAILCLENDEGT